MKVHPSGDPSGVCPCSPRQGGKAFLKAGVPLKTSEILEESAFRLTSCDNLHDYIPFVQQQEQKSVKDQINGRQVSVIFDGTTHVCEALVIVLRFVDEESTANVMAKSMFGEELARQLIGCRAILLLQPSSAAAERVLSLLSNYFKENQQNALEDYI